MICRLESGSRHVYQDSYLLFLISYIFWTFQLFSFDFLHSIIIWRQFGYDIFEFESAIEVSLRSQHSSWWCLMNIWKFINIIWKILLNTTSSAHWKNRTNFEENTHDFSARVSLSERKKETGEWEARDVWLRRKIENEQLICSLKLGFESWKKLQEWKVFPVNNQMHIWKHF